MRNRHCYGFLTIVLGLCVLAGPGAGRALADEVSGTVTAAASDRPALGAYKYTLSFSWSTSRGLSHWDLILRALECSAICDGTAPIAIPDTAGSTTDGECAVFYGGIVACDGDPSTEEAGPLLKFEALPDQSCKSDNEGMGTFVFYTNLPPGQSQTWDDVILVKNGRFKDYGDLVGALPGCQLANATEDRTWGRIKTIFR